MKKKLVYTLPAALLLVLAGCSQTIDSTPETSDTAPIESGTIDLSEGSVFIENGGTYELTGSLTDGFIEVNAPEEDVTLVLNNATIDNENYAAIYVAEAKNVYITFKDGTVNTLKTGSSYLQLSEDTVDAVIYSKADLILDGNGTLNITTSNKHGIVSKDNLTIKNGTYNITAENHCLYGKDSVVIEDGSFNLNSGTDCIAADNEEDGNGVIEIVGGEFRIESATDGIYAVNKLRIDGGNFEITAAKKGLKSDGEILLGECSVSLNTTDDGIHSDGYVTVDGAQLSIISGDDGIHADYTLVIEDGNITIDAHEGLEATVVRVNGGTISVDASDDAINAGAQISGVTPLIEINGGDITINMAQGDTDAIDSNGSIVINGGTLTISAQSPFDYDVSGELNGGTVIVNGQQISHLTTQFGDMGIGGFGRMPAGTGPNGHH